MLTVTDGTLTANIMPLGQYMASQFITSKDGHGGTVVSITVPSATEVRSWHDPEVFESANEFRAVRSGGRDLLATSLSGDANTGKSRASPTNTARCALNPSRSRFMFR